MKRSNGRWRAPAARISRRGLLQTGGAAAAAATLAIVGCGEGDGGAPGGEETSETFLTPVGGEGAPQSGGNFSWGAVAVYSGLDPHLVVDALDLAAKFHGYLYSVDYREYPNGNSFEPQLAVSLEQPDEQTYIWKLRPGVRFHDIDPVNGREVVADDVVYSFTRRRDDPTSQNDKQLLRDFTERFDAPDARTFRLVTKRPYVPAYDELSNVTYAIVPHEAVEKFGSLMQNPVGCGAYVLDEFVKGERVKLKKNPNFYMPGLPYIDTREQVVIPDEGTITQAFLTKRQDWYSGSQLNKLKVDDFRKEDGVVIREYPNWWRRTLLLQVTRPPFNDKRVREAIDRALDRQDFINKMWFGEGKIAGPIVGDLEPWALPQEEVDEFYKQDLTAARQLLEAAGYGNGFDVELTIENVADLTKYCEIVKEQLAKIGINLKLVPQELGVYLAQTLYASNFEMTCYYNLPYSEPDRPLCAWFSLGQAGFSPSGYNSPEADAWIWKERSEFDPEKRTQIIYDAQRFFMREHGPQISTHTDRGYAAWWSWYHGIDEQRRGMRLRGAYTNLGVHDWISPRG